MFDDLRYLNDTRSPLPNVSPMSCCLEIHARTQGYQGNSVCVGELENH